MDQEQLTQAVASIVAEVRTRGDAALIDFTERWDRVRLTAETLRVPAEVIEAANADTEFGQALARAAERIRRFHTDVKPRSVYVDDGEGNQLGMRWTPIRAVGLYVPGGKAVYPSTLVMTAVPAQIAGAERIVVVSPPGPGGEVSEQVLVAAKILGIDEIYRVGGAQSVAALAIGTDTIPRVDKIFGPGNAFVAEAKKQLYGEVGIDMLAGPSEVVVYADHTANPQWVVAELMAQAEHDEDTCCTLLASDAGVLDLVRRAVAERVEEEPRRAIITASLERNGSFEVVESPAAAAERINEISPEHLSIQIENPWGFLPRIRNAGAIFLGADSPVAFGDYYAGPNDVLPTGRTARFASCLSVEDFMKRSNVCSASREYLERHGGDVEILARGEDLPAHARAIALRRESRPRGARREFDLVEAYHLVDEEGEVKLNQNESPWDIPPELKDAIFTRMREQPWNRYHQKLPEELRAAVAKLHGLPAAGVFLGNGSNLVLQWIFETFGGPGRAALIPAPSFSLFRMWGRLSGTILEEFRLVPADVALEYPAEEIAARVLRGRPALTVLNLPNNPTGSEMARDDVLAVLDAVEQVGGWLVVDEAYREFSDIDYDRVDWVRDGRRVLVLRTFSKALSAAGLRIGYALAPPEAADALAKIVPPFHTSLFNAVAGLEFLGRRDLFEERVRLLRSERDRVMGQLRRLGGVGVYRSSANFFLIRCENAEAIRQRLAERGLLVRQLGPDPLLDGCLRVNVGTPEENDRFLEDFAQAIGR